jgi:heptose I phosphotransferase
MIIDSKIENTLCLPFEQMMALQGECFRRQPGRLTQRVIVNGQSYFIKKHLGVGWKEIFKNILQLRLPTVSAKKEKLAIEKLQSLNIPVPSIVAFGQRGINPACMQSYILLEELNSIISLEDLTKTWKTNSPPFSLKYKLIKEVARIAGLLHENGVNHRDFYLCHFLLDTCRGDKIYLIDLHRAQIRSVTPDRWIIKDLAGLYFSSKDIGLTKYDLFRFMKFYSSRSLRNIWKSNKTFWKKVETRGERLYSDHARC